jgi:hypothetical protein
MHLQKQDRKRKKEKGREDHWKKEIHRGEKRNRKVKMHGERGE